MTTTAHPADRVAINSPAQPVTVWRVITSEWIKFRTLRSTLAVLGAAVLGMLVIAGLVAVNTRHLSGIQLEDAVPSATLQGHYLAQLLIGALGVLFVTGEYSTGMIRSTFGAVPTRLPVLVGKLVVFFVVTLVAMVASSVVAFTAAQAFLSQYRTGASLGDPGVLRIVLGTGLYLTLIGTLGAALGWIIRSTPGAIVTLIALILVLPVLFGNLLGQIGRDIAQYLPSNAGGSFISSLREPTSLTPWIGLGVLVAWVIVLGLVAAVRVQRTDV
ncbi:ABC-2 transporter permease [Williamsia deligens]|uniref:ABC transporter permease subunit n=1 Tax=Williamsia deligens TaxID=321325 RepID=A0ABW3G9A8_9NOCA|nr:ABC transporter permease subunit [Williamsia deligens]MCP2192546.1 ABC-2 family transporter protein [Williamsia deligens]